MTTKTIKPRKAFERERVAISFEGQQTMTKQNHKAECDINNILRGYQRTGILQHAAAYQGRYGNFISAPDYQAAMNALIEADEMFASLPAKVRNRFENDPAKFLEFAQDPSNEAEAREMGLLPVPYQERAKALSEPAGEASGASPKTEEAAG